jgi:hypothetical protein
MIDVQPIHEAIIHAEALRDQYRGKDKEQYKLWKQEVFRLYTDLLIAERINATHART